MLNSRPARGNSPSPQVSILSQGRYRDGLMSLASLTREVVKAMPVEQREMLNKFKLRPVLEKAMAEQVARNVSARDLIKAQVSEMIKAGVSTSTGYNFYDLRGPALLIYPVNVPLRNSLARMGRVNDGYGTAANWKATRNFGTEYIGAVEGQRVAVASPDENNYIATYKELGVERSVTFTAQFAGEGYTDNVADEHLRGLHELWLGEESLMLEGNAGTGTGNNGFVLGTANAPVAALAGTGAGFANGTTVSCRVIEITALGYPNNTQYGYLARPTVVGGLTPTFTRNNADGTTTTVSGGIGAVSAASNVVTALTGNGNVTFSVTPKAGAIAWAWFIDVTDASAPAAANAILSFITTVPTLTTGTSGAGSQTAAATGLNVDHSYNTLDFDGLLSYAASVGTWTNQLGAKLTPLAGGKIQEFETILYNTWQNFQAPVQTIWASADAKQSASDTIFTTVTAGSQYTPSAFRWNYTRDQQGNIMGGFTVDTYKSQFAMDPSGSTAIPLRIHPMLPAGTFYFDVSDNPYPQSRIPFVRGMLVQRDYYSIEWPITSRFWGFGTYCHEVLAHMVPWITSVLTGVAAS